MLMKRLICWLLGHRSYCFVRFHYPRFEPWLLAKCSRCERCLSKVSLRDVPLIELHTYWGVASDNPCLHYWGRNRLLEKQ